MEKPFLVFDEVIKLGWLLSPCFTFPLIFRYIERRCLCVLIIVCHLGILIFPYYCRYGLHRKHQWSKERIVITGGESLLDRRILFYSSATYSMNRFLWYWSFTSPQTASIRFQSSCLGYISIKGG
jgi:hypothetical protein